MKVKFIPQDVEVEIKPNQTVLNVAQEQGLHIQSVCKGIPSCAECRVSIKEGEYNVMPPTSTELSLIGTAHFVDHRRLSCQLRCFGDVTVDLTEQLNKESAVTKRPRGRAQKEEGESKAVMGNIMLDPSETVEVETQLGQADRNERQTNEQLQREEMQRELARIRASKGGGRGPQRERKERPERKAKSGDSRPRRSEVKSEVNTDKREASASKGEKSEKTDSAKKSSRNRNRRNNRRRKPKKENS